MVRCALKNSLPAISFNDFVIFDSGQLEFGPRSRKTYVCEICVSLRLVITNAKVPGMDARDIGLVLVTYILHVSKNGSFILVPGTIMLVRHSLQMSER